MIHSLLMKEKAYSRLLAADREEISRDLAAGEVPSEIARRLGRDPATVSREISRNSGKTDTGHSELAAEPRSPPRR